MDRQAASRENAAQRYFKPIPIAPNSNQSLRRIAVGAAVMAFGFLLWFTLPSWLGRWVIGGAFFCVGGVFAARFAWHHFYEMLGYQKEMAAIFPQPTDQAIDSWLDNGIERVRLHSLERLGLTPDDCPSVSLPPIISPILWIKHGLDPCDVVWKRGKDTKPRFGVYEIGFLWMAEHHLGVFSCDYNLIRDAILNEETYEFFYQDIISVSVREQSSALTLKTGESLTSVQELRISVANDPCFSIKVGAAQLKQLTGAEFVPESGVERTLSAIRKKMQDTKASLLGVQ